MDISTLEARIDELISLCEELEKKHARLEAAHQKWVQERTTLLEKNEITRAKVEAMIVHLKSLERG